LIHRSGNRWGGKAAVQLLNDYDFLVQVLFAEQANTSLKTHKNSRTGNGEPATATKFEKLVEIWDRVLPHRKLEITGDDIKVSVLGSTEQYRASEMSDGERAVFYLIGQTLIAEADSLIIFDEPELHIHRSIVARLWDELEGARSDCGMVVISHDLEFVASRQGQKLVLSEYNPNSGWIIEEVPEDSGFPEELTTLILGSRKPVLFVEGTGKSIDKAIYRACYPNWTIIPRGSCEEVLHAVVTMRANASLTRITCAGIVDADDHDASDATFMQSRGIEILPVSEIENLFLLPSVIKAILKTEGHAGNDIQTKYEQLSDKLFANASESKNQHDSVMRYCRRRIDRMLKKVDLSNAADIPALSNDYTQKTSSLNVNDIAQVFSTAVTNAIATKNCIELLRWYDNKGLLDIPAQAKGTTKPRFEQWIIRAMKNGSAPDVYDALRGHLPIVTPI
jgi:hypothetical protein